EETATPPAATSASARRLACGLGAPRRPIARRSPLGGRSPILFCSLRTAAATSVGRWPGRAVKDQRGTAEVTADWRRAPERRSGGCRRRAPGTGGERPGAAQEGRSRL